ncbi:MAG: amidohydrolase [Bacteroidota bacterium]
MQELIVTTVQTQLYWEDPDKNLAHLSEKLRTVGITDMIVLPEMFTTGFTMKPELLAEEHGGKGLQWMQKNAAEKKCVIVGSISVKEHGNYYNRLYWVKPDGHFLCYDKRHLFSMGKEDEHYKKGNQKIVVEYKGWKICPLVCYDLRFPVWSRNTKQDPYDVLIYVANWPEVRSYPWKQLLIARAIENQCYVVGVNRIGVDGHQINHTGDSAIINPKGELLNKTKANEDMAESISISYDALQDFRRAFPVLNDAENFSID